MQYVPVWSIGKGAVYLVSAQPLSASMLVLAALLAASAASDAPSTAARVRTRVTVQIVRGAALREGEIQPIAGEERPVRGRAWLVERDGSRREIQLFEFP